MVDQGSQDESAWIAKAKRGDPQALDQLVRSESARAERLLLRILGPRHDIDDLLQLVFLEVCKSLPKFRGDSSVSTFVGGITVRVARRAMRKSAYVRHRADAIDGTYVSQRPDPSRQSTARAQLRRVHSVLEEIKPKKRVAFILWALEGMTIEEIAKTTRASIPATRSRIFHAQKEIKAKAARDPELKMLVGAE